MLESKQLSINPSINVMYKDMKKFFVGIDFSKKRMDVSIVEREFPEKAIAYKQFVNDTEGAKKMCEWVEHTTHTSTKLDGEVLFCCEHTGSYCLEVCDYLSENGKYIWLGNPLDIKRSMGLVRGKDDIVDSRRIATFAAEKHHKAVLYMRPGDSTRALKYLLSLRNALIEQKKAFDCQMKENFPKLNDSALLCNIEEKIQQILESIKAEIKSIEKMMLDIILSDKEYKKTYEILTSMKGVALINAAAIIVFTNNFKRFSFNSRKICTYWGVTPFRNESGDSIRHGTHTSPIRNNWLKSILSEAVLCAIRYNERMRAYYLRLLAKGKHRNVALNNTKNKLLKTLVAMVRDGKEFDKNYVPSPQSCIFQQNII